MPSSQRAAPKGSPSPGPAGVRARTGLPHRAAQAPAPCSVSDRAHSSSFTTGRSGQSSTAAQPGPRGSSKRYSPLAGWGHSPR